MEELRTIWTKLNALQLEVGQMIDMDKVETVYEQLKKEEEIREKYTPYLFPIIGGTMLVLGGIIFSSNWMIGEPLDIVQVIGFTLICIGAIYLIYQFKLSSIIFKENDPSESTNDFLRMAKKQLIKRKKASIIGPILYTLLLMIGMYLIILKYINLGDTSGFLYGATGLHFGVMFALMGFTYQNQTKLFNEKYQEILERIDRFLID